jgi:polyisoprenoid-binding protein YceI
MRFSSFRIARRQSDYHAGAMFRFLSLTALLMLASTSSAAEYRLDPAHTAVYFAVPHYDISLVRGRIHRISGKVEFDPAARSGSLDILVDADSLDTGNTTLDQVLRSDQYLDTAQWGEVRFAGNGFVFDGNRLVAIDGTLVLHGIARPLRLTAERFTCKDVRLGLAARHVCGGEFAAAFRRSDFGMTRFLPDVGDMVTLSISVEATRQ